MPNNPEDELRELRERIANAPPEPEVRAPARRMADPFEALLTRARTPETPEAIAERDARERAAMDAEMAKRYDYWRERCPPALRVTDWNDPRLKPYRRQIDRVLMWEKGKRGLYAVGRSGRGKSRAFWALMHALCMAGLRVRILLQSDVTRIFNRDPKLFMEEMDTLRYAPFLGWDDFGKFDVIGARQDALHAEIEALIDYRASYERPMIFTSNCDSEALLARFGPTRGEPILRRLKESCEMVDFGW